MILGYPWLQQYNPSLNWANGTWLYTEPNTPPEVVTEDQFSASTQKVRFIYTVRYTDIEPADMKKPEVQLPQEYAEYADIFSETDANMLPASGPYDHSVDLEGGQPPYGSIYNLSEKELKTLREYLQDSLQRGWIRESTSPAGAPILFAPKKDGKLRLCVDYRGLNKVTRKNRYPIPLINEIIDRVVGAKIYTKLDLRNAYHRIRIRKGDEWKTAFRTRYGHFEYLVMPFGLANALATFQAYINRAMAGLLDVTCVVYLDDILIYSCDLTEHTWHVKEVLERLRRYSLYVKLSKCQFSVTQTDFLGYILHPGGIAMEVSRVKTIEEWPEPRSYRDIQVFLGFANFYRRFIANFSMIASPLSDMLKGMKKGKKTGVFVLTSSVQAAFRKLCDAFTRAPVLVHFDPKKPIQLKTDASGYAIAGILSQPADTHANSKSSAHWHLVAFWSRKMIPAERNYEMHNQELLAIVMCFKHWRHYLEGSQHPIRVLTDHANLRAFMTTKELSRWQAH